MLFDLCISLFDLQLHDFIWCHKHGIVWPIWPRVAVWPVTVAVASCSCGSTPDISRHLTTQSAMPRRVRSKLRLWNILKYPETSWNSWYFMECSPEQTLILCDFMIFYAILIHFGNGLFAVLAYSLIVLGPPSPMVHHTEAVDAWNLKLSRIQLRVLSRHTSCYTVSM